MRTRRPTLPVAALLAALALSPGCRTDAPDGGGAGGASDTTATAASLAFRDAVGTPPDDWTGPVFELSHDYPTTDPGPCAEADCPWLSLTSPEAFTATVDSSAAPGAWENSIWPEWMETVKQYIGRGQDPQLANAVGFQTAVGGETVWYHVPWMAYDPTVGRDFIHGTTNERTSHLSDLLGGDGNALHELPPSVAMVQAGLADAPDDEVGADDCAAANAAGFETWAVGVYNAYGGYALGQAFPPSGEPVVTTYEGAPAPAGLPFPEGTLVTKFLFTTATPDCVDYLEGSPEWIVDRHVLDEADSTFTCRRAPQPVRLVQVDVAAVDPLSPTRWIYGTFAYNGKIGGATVWENLEPVGIQWGSDPETWPATPEADSQPATQSVLNVAMTEGADGIYEHFGCRGRLAGPVDNKMSSCMSCHASAYAATEGVSTMGTNVPPSFGFSGMCEGYSQANADYFANTVFPDAYYGGGYPNTLNLDTSMQLEVAFTQYQTYAVNGQAAECRLDGGQLAALLRRDR